VASAPPAVIAPVSRAPPREMWTEITKDLVTKEGIESLGYQYEETEEFFYVMEYLRYVSFIFFLLPCIAGSEDRLHMLTHDMCRRMWRIWLPYRTTSPLTGVSVSSRFSGNERIHDCRRRRRLRRAQCRGGLVRRTTMSSVSMSGRWFMTEGGLVEGDKRWWSSPSARDWCVFLFYFY